MAFSKLLPPLAILLALATCKMSTDDLEPKTDAECAEGEKACGYKCVSIDDPATGCGNRWAGGDGRCTPCDSLPNARAACVDFHAEGGLLERKCACEPGWGDCDGNPENGCEMNVAGFDPGNCGACKRSCAPSQSQCVEGVCVPDVLGTTLGEPRGIEYDYQLQRVYWVDSGSGGELVWMGEFDSAFSTAVAEGLDLRPGSPAVSRIAFDDLGSYVTYVTGALPVNGELAIYYLDRAQPSTPSAVGTYYSVPWEWPEEVFQGLTVSQGSLFFSREGVPGPCFVEFNQTFCLNPPAGVVRGLTNCGAQGMPGVCFGYPEYGGTLSFVDSGMNEIVLGEQMGSWPSRIAIYPGLNGDPQWFWADENSGSVWHVPPQLDGQPGAPELLDEGWGPTEMDIKADYSGVVWTDRWAGKIRAWRAADGAVFDVAVGGEPMGVALTPNFIFWTDANQWSIQRVPR